MPNLLLHSSQRWLLMAAAASMLSGCANVRLQTAGELTDGVAQDFQRQAEKSCAGSAGAEYLECRKRIEREYSRLKDERRKKSEPAKQLSN